MYRALVRAGVWLSDRYTLSVVLVEARESARLNRMFLGKRGSANVLSFDYGDYGEVIIAPEVSAPSIKGRARTATLIRMIAHGMVHLSGVHHERSALLARRFRNIEREALAVVFRSTRQSRAGGSRLSV